MTAPAFPFATPHTAVPDAVLTEALHACARRNVPALQRLHELAAPWLLAELLQMLDDREAAEQALVECYVLIWQQAGTFSPERCRPGTWLRAIVRQYAIDILRGQHPTAAVDEIDAALRLMHAGEDAGAAIAADEDSATRDLRLLQLAYRSGRSSAEIARALACPARAVQQAIRRSLHALAGHPAP